MITRAQAHYILAALAFERGESAYNSEVSTGIVRELEAMYPGLLKETNYEYLLKRF